MSEGHTARPNPPMTIAVAFHDLPTIVGRQFLGEWFSVDAARLELFDVASYVNEHPFPYARGYVESLVEGYHLLSLLDHLVNPLVRVTDDRAYPINYGLDRVRFITPILAGQRFRVRGSITEVSPRHDGYLVVGEVTAEVLDREKPGFTANFRALWQLMEQSERPDPKKP